MLVKLLTRSNLNLKDQVAGARSCKKSKVKHVLYTLNRTLNAAASSIPEAREKAIRENQAWPRAWLDNEEYKELEQNKKCETNKQTNKQNKKIGCWDS